MNSNFTWEYDESSRHYIVRNANLFFVNFQGAEQDYNQKGRRNFRLEVPDDLADEMANQGIYVRRRMRPLDDGSEVPQNLLKVSVYPDAKIRLRSNKAWTTVKIDNDDPGRDGGAMLDREFSKGHVMNGEIELEFHVSRNTKIATASPYLRVDILHVPIRKSKLDEEYEEYERENYGE